VAARTISALLAFQHKPCQKSISTALLLDGCGAYLGVALISGRGSFEYNVEYRNYNKTIGFPVVPHSPQPTEQPHHLLVAGLEVWQTDTAVQ